ncbi:MAG: hypothetical protein C0391_04230 [Anaerolinea sp.]|nr:hypothetical protein [Anaerolinea sp.]
MKDLIHNVDNLGILVDCFQLFLLDSAICCIELLPGIYIIFPHPSVRVMAIFQFSDGVEL